MPLTEASENEDYFHAGKVRLHRRSVVPRSESWARLVIFHGYGDHGGRYRHVMRWFAERGVACHAFDQRGHGKASGRRGFVRRWEEFLEDVRAALKEEARINSSAAPRFILGHSHGGLVLAMGVIRGEFSADGVILCAPYLQSGVPVTAGRLALARAVGLLMPWARFASRLQETWISSDQQMLADSRADPLVLRTATPRWYVSMLAVQEEARRRAGEFTLPLLCLTGESDPIALPAAVMQFYESAASREKKLIRYPGFLHELLRETQRETVFADILAWMQHVTKLGAGGQVAAGAGESSDGGGSASL
jgi:lysophospholipase